MNIRLRPNLMTMSPKDGVLFVTDITSDDEVIKLESVSVDFYEYVKSLTDGDQTSGQPDLIEYLQSRGYQQLDRTRVLKDFEDFLGRLRDFKFID